MFHCAKKASSFRNSINFFAFSRTFATTTINQRVCHYEILGVKPTAEIPEIKKAFYDKAKLYHPDTNKEEDAEETFKLITKAYETLKDPISRQIYDLSKSNPNFNQDMEGNGEGSSAYSKYYTSSQAEGPSTDYYNNKWYGYGTRKPSEESQRDEYKNVRSNLANESIFDSLVFRVGLVIGVVVVYDMWKRYQTGKHNEFVDVQKQLLRGHSGDSASGALDGPLVFIKEKSKDNAVEKQAVDLRDYMDKRKEKAQRADDNYHNEF